MRSSSVWVVWRCDLLRSGDYYTSYWAGPDRSWGYSFGSLLDPNTGSLNIAIATFNSKKDAQLAIKDFGVKSAQPVRLEVALSQELEKAA